MCEEQGSGRQHLKKHIKGVSWANEPQNVSEQGDELPETDLPSPDPSESDYADRGTSSSSSTTECSSPPSSFPHSTSISISRPQIPNISMPADAHSRNTPVHDIKTSNSSPPSLRAFRSIPRSSADGRRLSSSSSQVGLWQKFKSNVRRPSARDWLDEDEKTSPRKGLNSMFGDAGKHMMNMTSNHAAQAVGR